MIKKILIAVFFSLVLVPIKLFAVTCDNSSDNVEIQAAINSATPGDTISVTGTCAIAASIVINKAITLSGGGSVVWTGTPGDAGATAAWSGGATFEVATSNYAIDINLSSDVFVRVTGIKFNMSTTEHGIDVSGKSFGVKNVRIDNNQFYQGGRAVWVGDYAYGVIDNNEFINCDIAIHWSGDYDTAWDRTIEMGTANSMYVEDNEFTVNTGCDHCDEQLYHQTGGRSVLRYNNFNGNYDGNTLIYDTHGNQDYYAEGNAFRGQPAHEIYNNNVAFDHTYRVFHMRSSSFLFYNNTITGSADNIIDFNEEEAWSTAHFPSGLDSTWPAEDQIMNTFIWNNTFNGSAADIDDIDLNGYTEFFQENRDFWMHAPQSSGGYEYYTDRQGAAGNDDDGTLAFSSSGANAYYPYTAYTYPHPLRSEAATPTNTIQGMTIGNLQTIEELISWNRSDGLR